MIATHFDHQSDWWKTCECEDCRLKSDEWHHAKGLGTEFPGGLNYEGTISLVAHEPSVFLLRCYLCDKLYIALEPFGQTPMIYPMSRDEEKGLMFNFWNGDRLK